MNIQIKLNKTTPQATAVTPILIVISSMIISMIFFSTSSFNVISLYPKAFMASQLDIVIGRKN